MVQLWDGQVGGPGRLITTVTVPRVRGSVKSTTRYTLSAYWDTSNPSLYGKRTLHAVILHSGFDVSEENVISHVSQSVNVDCYGEVDICGICGGDNSLCKGCDGVPLSGKVYDVCGKCGGDGSTCCVRKPSEATVHYIRMTQMQNTPLNKRVKIGDMLVWENMLDWNVKVTGGLFDYTSAPGYSLTTLKDRGFTIQTQPPPMTLDDATVNKYVQQYLSMTTMTDQSDPGFAPPPVPTPPPDSFSQYLRRSATPAESSDLTQHQEDHLGLSRFPGW